MRSYARKNNICSEDTQQIHQSHKKFMHALREGVHQICSKNYEISNVGVFFFGVNISNSISPNSKQQILLSKSFILLGRFSTKLKVARAIRKY